jgi:hypothetical protein
MREEGAMVETAKRMICVLAIICPTLSLGAPVPPADCKVASPDAAASAIAAVPATSASQAGDGGNKALLDAIKPTLPTSLQPYAELSLKAIRAILASTREDQNAIYEFAKTVRANVDRLPNSSANAIKLAKEVEDLSQTVEGKTDKLIEASYSDSLKQNANLSNQLKMRLNGLIVDSLVLHDCSVSEHLMKARISAFKKELLLIADRYLNSRQFRLGIGASLMYMPRLSYVAVPNIDLSAFQNQPFGGNGRSLFMMDFANRSSPALNLMAKVPFVQLDMSIPSEEQTVKISTPAQRFAVSGTATSPDILARSTIESKLNVELDAALSLSIGDVANKLGMKKTSLGFGDRWDVGVGLGATGFRVRENVSTDVRVRTDPSKTFNDLPSTGSTTSSQTFSFHAVYWRFSGSIWISDELQVGLVAKTYRKKTVDDGPVNIKGQAVSVVLSWYPTLAW